MTRSTYNIIIVEQDKKYYNVIEQKLKDLDECCITQVFKDCDEAIDYIKKADFYELPQLVYLNMDIDCDKTFEFLEEVKNHSEFRKIPVVIFTMESEPEKVNRAYRLYANSIIELPDDDVRLEELVKESWNFWLKTVKLPQRDSLI